MPVAAAVAVASPVAGAVAQGEEQPPSPWQPWHRFELSRAGTRCAYGRRRTGRWRPSSHREALACPRACGVRYGQAPACYLVGLYSPIFG